MDPINNDVSSILFYQRHNVQRTIRKISKKRYSELKDYSFPDIVFIATFGAPSDIPKYTPALVQASRINSRDFDFFNCWQSYCKALLGHERALAIYEGAIFLTAEILPKEEIEGWHGQHQGSLSRIKQISGTICSPQLTSIPRQDGVSPAASSLAQYSSLENSETGRPAKRRRTEETGMQFRSFESPDNQVQVYPMKLAARDKVPTILSDNLLEGLQTSKVWSKEHNQSLTETVCLFWPPDPPCDFFIDLIVSEPAAKAVSEATSQSNRATREVLGDFLYEGVMESECIKSGGELTDAVTTFDYGDGDRVVRVTLSHARGWVASRVYPTTE
ncbi:hypothetical protein FMUND_606 [Fusarium mundagurra]|uniref:Uncharacterized protein n=1 Tax=Fusarium mundagurra TaxID=1567541 RepID=A0A8H5Z7D4_9HYPO|nr:hypothetical protein FMUND_606 [Fusarium mundagurra]